MNKKYLVSIIIRTLNEGKYLEDVIKGILRQTIDSINVIIVDSGSTDNTLAIANKYKIQVIKIDKKDFTYGRALNLGLESVKNNSEIGISLSGHCIPKSKFWLKNLIKPIVNGQSSIVYGSFIGGDNVRTSEYNYFKYKFAKIKNGHSDYKYFNNGNSAFLMSTWIEYKFNEKLIAQEDIDFAKRAFSEGIKVSYSLRAMVIHIHNDSNKQLFNRLYKEYIVEYSIGVRDKSKITKDIRMVLNDFVIDFKEAKKKAKLHKALPGIFKFRIIQIISLFLSSIK